MKPRPWCACGKVRLADDREVKAAETGKRLHIHSFDRCTVHRVGIPVAGRRTK